MKTHILKHTTAPESDDGNEVAIISQNTRYEMDFRIPIGEIITVSKHPDRPMPEACLGNWMVTGYNADGSMKLVRYA